MDIFKSNKAFEPIDENIISSEHLFMRHAGLSLEKQTDIANDIGIRPWNLDIATGKVKFGQDEFNIQLLGSYSKKNKTWLWSWGNHDINPCSESMISANNLRTYGEEINDAFLTTAFTKADEEIAHRVGSIACGLYNDSFYYCGDYGDGIIVFTVKDVNINSDIEMSDNKILDNIKLLIKTYDLNHRYAIYYYLKQKHFELVQEERSIIAQKGEIKITCEFNGREMLKRLYKN